MLTGKFGRVLSRSFNEKVLKLSRGCCSHVRRQPELDFDYLCDPGKLAEIDENVKNRKGIGDIRLVHEINDKLKATRTDDNDYEALKMQLLSEMCKIPNKTHPAVCGYGESPKIVREVGEKPPHDMGLREFQEITKRLKLVRTDQLGNLSGNKSYYLTGEMAELEHALVRYVVNTLIQNEFELISVPDILHQNIIEGCGMNTQGARTQVYSLDPNMHEPGLCLSGTSEMALAGFLTDQILSLKDLPLKLAAMSRCYRAETSNLAEERGIYRVHEFTKVEMFVVSEPEKSNEALEDILRIQETIFGSLGLHFKVLDMPPHELGAQAYRKYDIEAWLAGRRTYGEISSCSNCLDYQSRRLGIKFDKGGNTDFVHTLNGTACAVPRLLIALIEGGQRKNGTVAIPEPLSKFMRGKTVMGKQKRVPELKLVKNKK